MRLVKSIGFVWIVLLSLTIMTVSCNSDDDVQENVIKVTRIEVEGITDDIVVLEVADTYKVNVKLLPDAAEDKDAYSYEYSSANEEVFKVNEDGVITAIGVGEAALRIDPVNNTDLWTSITVKVNSKLFLIESLDIDPAYQDFYMGIDKSINLSEIISINPEFATNKDLIFASDDTSVATITRRGVLTTVGLGDVNISIKSDDGSNIEKTIKIMVRNTTYQNLDRDGWEVTTSHPYFADGTVVGTPESLIDDPDAYGTMEGEPTCLVLVKPGKSLGGITVGNDEEVYFIIDMKKEEDFDAFYLRHRLKNASAFLRLAEASVYGSNNGVDFEPVAEGLSINVEENEVIVDLPKTVSYRYFKLTYDKWHATGNTVQISDFNIIKLGYEEL
ncbi:discoidin domain-containing protein [Gelidibacter japonicus]|uniref:discoidin domain-containing protein n=1 Tax=Gelidibacter japonicus TaxID=1962232 RepID=UPI002AFDE5B5|nr:discoidin domain-containing protein [Gelidibacter japonicus]